MRLGAMLHQPTMDRIKMNFSFRFFFVKIEYVFVVVVVVGCHWHQLRFESQKCTFTEVINTCFPSILITIFPSFSCFVFPFFFYRHTVLYQQTNCGYKKIVPIQFHNKSLQSSSSSILVLHSSLNFIRFFLCGDLLFSCVRVCAILLICVSTINTSTTMMFLNKYLCVIFFFCSRLFVFFLLPLYLIRFP